MKFISYLIALGLIFSPALLKAEVKEADLVTTKAQQIIAVTNEELKEKDIPEKETPEEKVPEKAKIINNNISSGLTKIEDKISKETQQNIAVIVLSYYTNADPRLIGEISKIAASGLVREIATKLSAETAVNKPSQQDKDGIKANLMLREEEPLHK